MKMRFLFAVTALFSLTSLAHADAELDAVALRLTSQNHIFGQNVGEEEVYGRVIVVWRIDSLVGPLVGREEVDSDDGNIQAMREQVKALRAVAKNDLRDGRMLIILADTMPTEPKAREERIEAVRKLKPLYPVYDLPTPNTLFDASGVKKGNFKQLGQMPDEMGLKALLENTPDYVPGRLVCYKTKYHENACKQFVLGKNFESALANMRRTAAGTGDRAEEAKQIVATVDGHLTSLQEAIQRDLASAPSLALERLALLQTSCPGLSRRYSATLRGLRANPEVKQLSQVRDFLRRARHGEMGSTDMGNRADDMVKKMKRFQQSKNPAVAQEAAALEGELMPYTRTAIEQARDEIRAQAAERKAKDKEREKEAAKRKRKNN